MPVDLSKYLVIGVSSRALFDLEEANLIFEKKGVDAYADFQMERVDQILQPGKGFPLIKALLELNSKSGQRKAEVVIMSRNNPATSLRMFNSITHYGLDILRAALTGGASLAPYLHAFHVDLFLTGSEADVRAALKAGVAAALICGTPPREADPQEQIRIAFDGDAVLFSDEAERIYQEKGMEAFLAHELENAKKPLPDGPFAKLLRTLSVLQSDPAFPKPPIRIALITARNMPAHERVIRTLLAWNVRVDEAFFMGGVSKTKILEAFRPHIYFDDQETHCEPASKLVPTAKVIVSKEEKGQKGKRKER
ncbi:MAG TPA: 5'-nucleotidase [Gemmataceae bacterium]|nr:5'-nucleotidase [Gemmataceae bacterium]